MSHLCVGMIHMKFYSVDSNIIPTPWVCCSGRGVASAATLGCLGAVFLQIHPVPGSFDLHQGLPLTFLSAKEV